MPLDSFADSVSKNELSCHPGSCPSINVIKSRSKCIRDNILGCWDDTWLPISQFELTNTDTVTFTDPLMTIHINELFLCISYMALFKFTGQSPSSATSFNLNMSDQEVQDSINLN